MGERCTIWIRIIKMMGMLCGSEPWKNWVKPTFKAGKMAGLEVPEELNVEPVGDYQPTDFGFVMKEFMLGLVPPFGLVSFALGSS